jgi:methylamine utilization protein MauE
MTPGLAKALRGFLRFAIALVLAATAIGKLLDVPGFARVLGTYRAFSDGLLLPLAWSIPAAELALAAWLVTGRRLYGAALASAAMHAVYAAWSAVAIARGLKLDNCGCFGVFLARPLNWGTVAEDGAMVIFSAALAGLARRRR